MRKICILCERLHSSFDENHIISALMFSFFRSILNEQRIQWVQLDRLKEALKCNDTYLHLHRISCATDKAAWRTPTIRMQPFYFKLVEYSKFFFFTALMRQMFSIGERSGLQTGQFSTQTFLLRSHAVVIAAVCGFALSCWNTQGLPWNRCRLEGSICCSKTFIYLPAFIVPSKTCKLPISYALMHPYTIRDAGFWTELWWHTGRSPSSLARRTRHLWFPTRMSNLDSSDHRTLFHWTLKQSILNEPWPTGHDDALDHVQIWLPFLHGRALVGICRWHGGLCLPTVVSGSISGPI